MKPGTRTADHWRVGRRFRVLFDGFTETGPVVGECVSVTPWGNDQVRWVRLRLADGSEKSFAPSHLHLLEEHRP